MAAYSSAHFFTTGTTDSTVMMEVPLVTAHHLVFGQQGGSFSNVQMNVQNRTAYGTAAHYILAAGQVGAPCGHSMDSLIAEAIKAGTPAPYPVVDLGTGMQTKDGLVEVIVTEDACVDMQHHETKLRHDFTDPYCQAKRGHGRIAWCKRCGSLDDTIGHCPGEMPGWQRHKDATVAERMKVREQFAERKGAPAPLVQGYWEPSASGLGGMGCRMVHNDRVR